MTETNFIFAAKTILEKIKGKPLSLEERCDAAVELAGYLLQEASRDLTIDEQLRQTQLSHLMEDPKGKALFTAMTDQCYRCASPARAANQLAFNLNRYGIPSWLAWGKRFQMLVFKWLGTLIPSLLIPLVRRLIRQEMSPVILPEENGPLMKHLALRKREHVRVNLNHLGEAILGEDEAFHRLNLYLNDLSHPEIDYISVKISTLYSQINLIAPASSLKILAERLRQLFRAALKHSPPKFVNLDMEEYRDFQLTIDLFKQVLEEPEFHLLSAGIVLQSYLPDAWLVQQELTAWAIRRVQQGGAPIKIRLVKGANLAMEKVDAALRGFPQAPFSNKKEVDANFKKMAAYGCDPKRAAAVHLGIGSHNLFDIAYALLLRAENGVENFVEFEMLEGMADPLRRVIQALHQHLVENSHLEFASQSQNENFQLDAKSMVLYCPITSKSEFQYAVAYLVRRLDENTSPGNFLRHAFDMQLHSKEWENQVAAFRQSCEMISSLNNSPKRSQNRFVEEIVSEHPSFENEPDTDWALPNNQAWAKEILDDWSRKQNEMFFSNKAPHKGEGIDPAYPDKILYRYPLAEEDEIDKALKIAVHGQIAWCQKTLEDRYHLIGQAAQALRQHRATLIGAMVADTGKAISEADTEVSEAIDFAEYYRRNRLEIEGLQDIQWEPKGVVVVAPPWNFPCSIPAGGIFAALAAGNSVIFKPAQEAVWVGWKLSNILWSAGISKEVLQCVPCADEPAGSRLIQDKRTSTVLLTGGTDTARLFLKRRPDLDLMAETGGKNTMIVTAMSDRDLAIKHIIDSAFGYAGQKCSACSLLICEAEVYEDPHFRKMLKNAAESLLVAYAWDPASKVTPLIRPPGPDLLKALTTLEKGEQWLLQPRQMGSNPHLWSPGIKLGVKPNSFTYRTELFGPLLGVMKAKNLPHALALANGTPYGLTAGLHSLDEREHHYWINHIEAGNCYINRGITGAIVQRQPFGGFKSSHFGPGAKTGGPNYLMNLMHPMQKDLPLEQEMLPSNLEPIGFLVKKIYGKDQVAYWEHSVRNYAFYWRHYFSKKHDPSQILGQANFLSYRPHPQQCVRIQNREELFDAMLCLSAAAICEASLTVSLEKDVEIEGIPQLSQIKLMRETESQLIQRLAAGKIKRMRYFSSPTSAIYQAAAAADCYLLVARPLSNGRVELLRYLREISLSIDYHRYGYISQA